MKYTMNEYSQAFKMSQEMVASKIKSKQVNYVIEEGVTYIITQDEKQKISEGTLVENKQASVPAIIKPTVATVLALYQRENKQLKEKISQLEAKIDKLIDDKEQMLRAERDKIEEIYLNKDLQLRNILELVNSKFILENKEHTIHDVETFENKEEPINTSGELVELKEYLKTLDLKSYQRKIIKRRFLAVYDSDIRIIHQNGKLYLNFDKYDYTDLLEY